MRDDFERSLIKGEITHERYKKQDNLLACNSLEDVNTDNLMTYNLQTTG